MPTRPSGAIRFDLLARRLFLVAIVALAPTAALPATQPTHLGQNIADHVILRVGVSADRNCGHFAERIFPSGIRSEFTFPSGKTLVVTDLQWEASRSLLDAVPPIEIGKDLSLYFLSEDLSDAVFYSSPLLVTAENVNGLAKTEHLTAGFAMNAIPCLALVQDEGLWHLHSASGVVRIYGYLIPSPTR
jgi:hypothetical protein